MTLLRWPLTCTAVAGVTATLIWWALDGADGLLGAALGAAITLVFFTISLLVMTATSRLHPQLVMGVALLTYGVKIGVLGVLLVALYGATWLSSMALAVTVIACTGVWVAAQMVGARRARMPVYDEPHD